MKKTLRFLSVALVLVMAVCALCACPTPDEDPGNNPPAASYAEIAGEYYLDAAELGMPMAWYVKVTADGNFTIATKRTYEESSLKGKGTVGKSGETYMFLYEDSTADKPKTATFTVVDKNLVFSTSVPVGAASVSPKTEGDVTTYPTAKIIGAEEILGTYIGEYDKTTGMGNVLYSYELTLGYGYTYTFESSFAMMGNTYTRTETGKFTVDGASLTFTADAEGATPVSGTLADKKITTSFKLSQMADAADEITVEFAPYADIAGTYSATYAMQMDPMSLNYNTFLTQKGNGDYTYAACSASDMTAPSYTESGKFTVDGKTITFTSDAEGATPVSGTLENYVLAGDELKFKIESVAPAAKMTFYADCVQGCFKATASGEGEGAAEYAAILILGGNKFQLAVGQMDAANPNYSITGTITVARAMGAVTITLTSEHENTAIATITAAVSANGINAELIFDLEDTAKLGFQFVQDMSFLEFLQASTGTTPAPENPMG